MVDPREKECVNWKAGLPEMTLATSALAPSNIQLASCTSAAIVSRSGPFFRLYPPKLTLHIPGQVLHSTGLDQTHVLLPAVESGISVQNGAGNGVEDVGDSIEVRCECAGPSRLLCGDGHRFFGWI